MFILDDQLSFNIHRVSIILRREMIRCFREFDLNPEQWQVIVSLWERKKLTQTEIIEITLQDAPSVSKMLARMEKKGWVMIRPSKKDKRIKTVSLTAKGRANKKTLPAKLSQKMEKLIGNFPMNKRLELTFLLKELRNCLGDR